MTDKVEIIARGIGASFSAAERALGEPTVAAQAALDALKHAGFVVVPVDPERAGPDVVSDNTPLRHRLKLGDESEILGEQDDPAQWRGLSDG